MLKSPTPLGSFENLTLIKSTLLIEIEEAHSSSVFI